MAKAKKITNEQRQKVISDYAIASGVKRSYNLNEHNLPLGTYILEEGKSKTGEVVYDCVTAAGILKEGVDIDTEVYGASPALSYPLCDLLGKGLEIKEVDGEHIVELGMMPQTRADDALQTRLARKKAGKDGLVELDGKQYKAVVVKAADPEVVAEYGTGKIDENGKVVFFTVEPMTFVVTNYADLPPMLNPEGTGTAETFDIEAKHVLMPYEEYKKTKGFAASLITGKTKFTARDKKQIIKLINENPANINIIPDSLILDEDFMASVNQVLSEKYQAQFKAGMKKKDAKKVEKQAKGTAAVIAGKVARVKAEQEAEEAKKKAEEEAKKAEEEAKKRPEPTVTDAPKKEKKPAGKLKKKIAGLLTYAKDVISKLGTINADKATTYQNKMDAMFPSTTTKKKPEATTTTTETTTETTTTPKPKKKKPTTTETTPVDDTTTTETTAETTETAATTPKRPKGGRPTAGTATDDRTRD